RMVDRFLGWKLPGDFNPDGGISFSQYGNVNTPYQYKREPTGTNLFDAAQAEAMIRFMFTEPEPECPDVCDLLWESNPFPNTGSQHRHDSAVREAFKRGQQSMIRKDG
ncbi:MAG: hypothetical protein KGL39_49230, partial [Patescibacteria group bacterium]|nr:hypothetical protein [Patescibacteria group bacterium]